MADLPAFDPKADFVASLPIRYRGKALAAGQPIDKQLAGDTDDKRTTVLKVLYENRRIELAPAPASDAEKAAGLPALTDVQKLRVDDLVANNDRNALNTMAAAAPLNIVAPEKLGGKPDVAAAIVRAEAATA